MKKNVLKTMLALAAFCTAAGSGAQTADFNVVPRPQQIVHQNHADDFTMTASTVIVTEKNKACRRNAAFLQQFIEERTGMKLKIVTKAPATNFIALRSASLDNAEGYTLEVRKDGITICGGSDAGTFYGIQTLRKSMPHMVRVRGLEKPRVLQEVTIPAVKVNDAPRFSYRGTHLDVSRHYVTPDSIRRFIDMLALHNINRFH